MKYPRIGVSSGMRGWYSVLYDQEGPIHTGICSFETKEEAIQDAQCWAQAEELGCDYPLVNENLTKNQKQMSEELKVTSIKKILDRDEFSDGDNVKKIKGKITAMYPVRKGGDGDSGYEYQNCEFEGEDGGKIRICFSKCTQPTSAKGQKVTIHSIKNDQRGWLGIQVKDGEHDGKKTRELRIVPSAVLEYSGQASTGSGGGSGGSSGGGEKSQPAQSKRDDSVHPIVILKDLIGLHAKIVDLVNESYGESAKPEYIATLFIEAAKNGLAFNFLERVSKPVPIKYPPAPKDYSLWKECVMPWGKEGVIGKKLSELPEDKLREIHIYFDEKGINTDLAECVYQAARDLGLFKKEEEQQQQQAADDAALDAAPDDIPF